MYIKDGFDYVVIYEEEIRFNRQYFPELKLPSFEDFVSFCDNCPTLGLMSEGVCVGGMLVHDKHLHLMICESFRGRWALLWPASFKWALAISDPLYALMPVRNQKIINFIKSIGGHFENEEIAYGCLLSHRFSLETKNMKYPKHGWRATK